jgi:internalin A
VDTLPHVRDLLPETWFTVKSKLEELGRDKNFITQDEYLSLCGANDVTDETSQHTLIGFLHDLGVVLHFQDDPRLEALGILNPQWVTNGVYKILNSHELFQNQGTLTLPMLNKIFNPPEYPRDKRLFIVDMMKKFELCYDIEPDKSFLIPDLLPKDEPYTGEWEWRTGVPISLQRPAHQHHLALHRAHERLPVHKTVWRSGVVLKSGGNTALVKADTEDRKIYIWVSGDENTRRDFLSAIRMEFSAIHKTIAKIEATEKVPLPNYPNADPVDYDFLLQLERERY